MEDKNIKKVELFVTGMHCNSCEMLIEREISKLPFIKSVKSFFKKELLILETTNEDKLIEKINEIITPLNYSVSSEKTKDVINYKDLLLGFVIAFSFMALFFALQELGIANILNVKELSYLFIFMIGVIASLSTCMAIVGGLVLSISSSYQKGNEKIFPLFLFHASRIISFLILGGLIGFLGSKFKISQDFYFITNLLLFLVMIILGLNLLDISHIFSKLQFHLPKFLTERVIKNESVKNRFTPILLGALTFFLPCGFTQSMQFNAIASGDALSGGLIMFFFALGTLPVLAFISFSSVKFSAVKSELFFKTAGFIIIFFAIFNLLSAFVAKGYIKPIF